MRAEGREERHVGPVPWKGEGRGKPDVIASLGRCAENRLLKGACLESLFASGTSAAIAAMACMQGGHPLVTMSSCFDRKAMGAQVSPAR